MENFSFTALAKQLDLAKEEGITFEDKLLNWNTAEDVKEVVNALNEHSVVHYLKLDGNTLGVEGARAIGEALKSHPEFRKALWKNMFTGRLKTEIPEALKHLGNGLIAAKAHLTVLDLSDNALGPNGMIGLEEFLRSPVCYSLQELRLNNCGLGIGGGRMLSKAMLDCHAKSHAAGTPLQLKVFVAGRNRLENDGAIAIAQMIGTLQTLEEIVMPQNSIYHVGVKALAEGFRKNLKLRTINLNDNTVSHKGAAALADALSVLPNLHELNLGDCLLKSRGALFIADVLDMHHGLLEVVDLSFNEITANAGLELAAAMQNKPHLKSLNLDGNEFGHEGCEQIKALMGTALNPNALMEFTQDESEDEADNDNEGSDDDEESNDEDNQSGEDNESGEDECDSYDDEYADEYENYNGSNIPNLLEETQEYVGETSDSEDKDPNEYLSNAKTDQIKVKADSKPINAEAFCLSRQPCTLEQFNVLKEENKFKAFMNVINQFNGDNQMLLRFFTTLKCAHLSKASPEALELAKDLYTESFEYAFKNNLELPMLQYYAVQLGLMDSEEPFRPLYDIESCRYALRETIRNRNISSETIKREFNVLFADVDKLPQPKLA